MSHKFLRRRVVRSASRRRCLASVCDARWLLRSTSAMCRCAGDGMLLLLLLPAPAHAACGTFDLTTCMNAAQYALWEGVASELWSINRVLLTLAYQLDVLRAWLIDVVFTSVFQVITDTISPALAPVATIAVLVGILLFLLMPVIGRVDIVNIRRALVWTVAAPLLLGAAGQGLAQAEQIRTGVGQTMFAAAQEIGSAPLFGAPSDEMNTAAQPLYPFSGCGTGTLVRPFADAQPSGLFMDDLAASMMYADAEDIHCPTQGSGPGSDLPDGFFSPAEGGPPSGGGDYATTQSVSDMSASDSAAWTVKIQNGCTRLLMGIVPSLLAVMNAIIQLLFALALVLLFVALPLGLLLVFFTDSSAGVTALARRMMTVLQTSWSSSLVLGIVFAALLAVSALGNVAAFVGLSLAGVLLTCFIIMIAVNACMSSVQVVAQTVGMTTGISGSDGTHGAASDDRRRISRRWRGGPVHANSRCHGASAMASLAAGTSRRYAAGAAAGRIGGGRACWWTGRRAGHRERGYRRHLHRRASARGRDGYRLARRLATTDAAKRDDVGRTMREREQERDLQRQADQARRGNAVDPGQHGWSNGARWRDILRRRHALVAQPAQRIAALSGDVAHAAWERARAAQDAVVHRAGDDPSPRCSIARGRRSGAVGLRSRRAVRSYRT